MKFFTKMTLLTVALAGTTLGMTGCKSTAKMPVTFVAATTSEYNASVQFGDFDYKFRGKVDQKSDKFLFDGLATRHFDTSNNNSNVSSSKSKGGEEKPKEAPVNFAMEIEKTEALVNERVKATLTFTPNENVNDELEWSSSDESVITVEDGKIRPVAPGVATVTAKCVANPALSVTTPQITVKAEDTSEYDWAVDGTWKMDEGYGYVITINDERNDGKGTVVHADFDKIQGRHQFYYTVNIGNGTSTVLFQAKDPTFKDRLAKDYQSWDVRDSKYIYYAKATGNNNSVATAYLYLHNDGSAVINAPKSGSADRTTTFGLTWSETNGVVTLRDTAKEFVSKSSVNSAKPGSWLHTDSYEFIRSDNADVKWKKMTAADFDSAYTYEYNGSFTSSGPGGGTTKIYVALYNSGDAKVYANGSFTAAQTGTWELVDGVVNLHIGMDNFVENADHSIDFKYNNNELVLKRAK